MRLEPLWYRKTAPTPLSGDLGKHCHGILKHSSLVKRFEKNIKIVRFGLDHFVLLDLNKDRPKVKGHRLKATSEARNLEIRVVPSGP